MLFKWAMSPIIVSFSLTVDYKKGYRSTSYSFTDYLAELNTYTNWIKAALLGTSSTIPSIVSPALTESEFPRLVGPDFAIPWLVPYLAEYAAATAGTIQELSIHRLFKANL